MSVIGIFTDIGLDKIREVENNAGFRIYPESFSVSDTESDPDVANLTGLVAENANVWYSGNISTRIALGASTIQVLCTIPPNVAGIVGQKEIKEIYVKAKDVNNNDFILAVGQPDSTTLLYDPQGSTSLRLQFTLTNVDISSQFVFNYTQQTEVSAHNTDPNAHQDIRSNLAKAGIFEQAGLHTFIGQHFDEFVNGSTRSFANDVVDGDPVYLDTDNVYKRAVADGTVKSNVSGFADVTRGQVYEGGFFRKPTGLLNGTILYLHPTNAGQLTNIPNEYPIAQVLDSNIILIRIDHKIDVKDYFDAIVSDEVGVKHYPTLEEALVNTPINGWVRVDKLQELNRPDPIPVDRNILFTGTRSGFQKFLGVNEIQTLSFSATPDEGEFVLEHNGNRTTRLGFNSTTVDVKNALEALASINEVNVTGSVSGGFTIEYIGPDTNTPINLIAVGTGTGVDEVQKLAFSSDDFDSGSFKLEFNGIKTAAIPFTSINAGTIAAELLALPDITTLDVQLEVSPPIGTVEFNLTFTGVDGKKDQPLIIVPSADNTLEDILNSPIALTVNSIVEGLLPDNTLKLTGSEVFVNTSEVVDGAPIGTDTAILVDSDEIAIIGLGKINGFSNGIDLNSHENIRIEMFFDNIPTPIIQGVVPALKFNTEGSLGYDPVTSSIEESSFRNLVRVDPELTPSSVVNITPAEIVLSDGSRHGLVIDQRISSFIGANVNFATGNVVGGENFTPYSAITSGHYYKYAIVLLVDDSIKVVGPVGEGATPSTAPAPNIDGGLLRAIVTVHDNGAGGIDAITTSSIKRFFDTGAYVKNYSEKRISIPIGSPQDTFDVTGSFEFDPNNEIFDIEVHVNGVEKTQDYLGDFSGEYVKISSTQLRFIDEVGDPYPIPSGQVVIKHKASTPDLFTVGAAESSSRFAEANETPNGSVSDFSFTGFNFSVDNNIYDVDIFLNNAPVFPIRDYIKLANNTIRFVDDDGTTPYSPLSGNVYAKQRVFNLGGVSQGSTFSMSDEGVEIVPNVGEINVNGPAVEVTSPSSGVALITVSAEENKAENIGIGEGVFEGKAVDVVQMNRIRGINGIEVGKDANGIFIGKALSPYFREYKDGLAGFSAETTLAYDVNSFKLGAYRNGVRIGNINLNNDFGQFVDRMIESSVTSVSFFEKLDLVDVISLVNSDVKPEWQVIVKGNGTNKISVPYITDKDRLVVHRNGVYNNDLGVGAPVEQYSAVNGSKEITLGVIGSTDDWFLVEYLGEDLLSKEPISGVVGNILTLTNPLNLTDDKEFVLKNGLLLHNSTSLGSSGDRYTLNSPTEINLGLNANLNDSFVVLRKG